MQLPPPVLARGKLAGRRLQGKHTSNSLTRRRCQQAPSLSVVLHRQTSSNTLYMSAMVQVSEECGAWCYVDPGSGCGDKRPSVTGAG